MILSAFINDIQKFNVKRLSQSLIIDFGIMCNLTTSHIRRKLNSTADMVFLVRM